MAFIKTCCPYQLHFFIRIQMLCVVFLLNIDQIDHHFWHINKVTALKNYISTQISFTQVAPAIVPRTFLNAGSIHALYILVVMLYSNYIVSVSCQITIFEFDLIGGNSPPWHLLEKRLDIQVSFVKATTSHHFNRAVSINVSIKLLRI